MSKAIKKNRFKSNKVKLYILPEKIFASVLNGTKTDEEIIGYVKKYIDTTPNIEQARLILAQDTDITFEPELTEEVKVESSMDPDNTELILETPNIKNYLFKTSAMIGDNIYLLELLFNGVKVFKTSDNKLGYKTLDKTTDVKTKGSIVVVQHVTSGNIYAGYKFIPNTAFKEEFKNKSTQTVEIELKQIMGDGNVMFYNSLLDAEVTETNFIDLPVFTVS